ncbi:MAG: hypothetical protein WEB00_05650 [Dehalococcoidia bacterium]
MGTLTLTCLPSDDMLGGGFFGVGPGTHVRANLPHSLNQWKVSWRNDSTVDSVGIRVLCMFKGIIGGDKFFATEFGPGSSIGATMTLSAACGDGATLLSGGWDLLDPASSISASRPGAGTKWQVSWRNGASPDNIKVRAFCFTSSGGPNHVLEQETGRGGAGPGEVGALTTDCSVSILIGGGFSGLAPGFPLMTSGPYDSNSWRQRWLNGPLADQVTNWLVCLD